MYNIEHGLHTSTYFYIINEFFPFLLKIYFFSYFLFLYSKKKENKW